MALHIDDEVKKENEVKTPKKDTEFFKNAMAARCPVPKYLNAVKK